MNANLTSDLYSIIEIYYSKHELNSNDIAQLFNLSEKSTATISRLKRLAKKEMLDASKESEIFNVRNVLTECAFKAWKIDIDDIERRYAKLLKMRKRNDNDRSRVATSGI